MTNNKSNNNSMEVAMTNNKSNNSMEVAMTNKRIASILDAIDTKMAEVRHDYDNFKRNLNREGNPISPNTGKTQSQIKSKELKELRLLNHIMQFIDSQGIEELTLEPDVMSILTNILTLTGERTNSPVTIIVKDGDQLTDLLQKYSKVTNLYNRLMSVAEAEGLVLVGTTFKKEV